MIIALHIGRTRVWHRRLADRLEALGHGVTIEAGRTAPPVTAAFVLAVERRLYRSASILFDPTEIATQPLGRPDLAILLDGKAPSEAICLRPQFDGEVGDPALFAALLRGRAPRITIRASDGVVLATGFPAVEDPLVLSRALDAVLARLVTIIVEAVGRVADRSIPSPAPISQGLEPIAASHFLARGLIGKLVRKFGPARGRPDHWRIAYRIAADPNIAASGAWPTGRFDTLDDDGTRFYADPFPFVHEGRHHIFFEDFPYATGKGVIGVVDLDAAGTASAPRTVLETPVHLSYPFLIQSGSDIYMLPEMSGARRVQLFRADPFPDRWVPDKVLIDDVIASDATVIQHGDRVWLFATLSDGGDSTWDQLGVFHAPSLFGPWTAHPGNPVLIDAGAARPAGAMWHEDGHLMRVAQDCRTGYGAGLAICRVDRLDPSGFAQTVVHRLGPPAGYDAAGAHTLNRCGDLEVIDLRLPHRSRYRHRRA